MCSRGGLLDFGNGNMWPLISLIWAGPAFSITLFLWSFCYYGVSVHRGETVQPGAHLSPASELPLYFWTRSYLVIHNISFFWYIAGIYSLIFLEFLHLSSKGFILYSLY